MPEESVLAQLSIDSVKVEKLVREFLTAQSLTILPQNSFGDAVSQFVDKDDRHAMEAFVVDNLSRQVKHLISMEQLQPDASPDELANQIELYRSNLEQLFAEGHYKNARQRKIKPKPAHWDSDLDGPWADDPGAILISDNDAEEDEDEEGVGSVPPRAAPKRGRGAKTMGTTRASAAPTRPTKAAAKTPAAKGGRGKKKVVEEESEEEEDDVVMHIDDDVDEDEEEFPPRKPTRTTRAAPARAASPAKKTTARASTSKPSARQTQLNFSQSQRAAPEANGRAKVTHELVSLA